MKHLNSVHHHMCNTSGNTRYGRSEHLTVRGILCSAMLMTVALACLTVSTFAKKDNNTRDYYDRPPASVGSSGVDITRWSVSEPFINLWLSSQPLSYQSSFGKTYAPIMAFHQRQSWQNIYGFGQYWGFNWRSFVFYTVSNGTNVDSGSELWLPLGGLFFLDNTGAPRDFWTYYSVSIMRNGTNGVTGFTVQTPSGGRQIMDLLSVEPGYGNYAWLTQDIDAQNRTNIYQYEIVQSTRPRLIRMIDPDNRTNVIKYLDTNSLMIAEIDDPYGRKVTFGYDGSYNLTSITNANNMVDAFKYDGSGAVTNLVTAYGTNTFQYVEQSFSGLTFGGTNQVNRSMLVTEPNLSRELFMYRDDCSKLYPGSSTTLLPSSYSTAEVPVTTPLGNLFDNTSLDTANSFHWGKSEFEGLSTTFTNTLSSFTASCFNSMSTNDYNLARFTHWLRWWTDNNFILPIPSMTRAPGASSSTVGQKLWFDYAGKDNSYPWCVGTNSTPLFQAVVLPDGNTRFKYTTINQWGYPTAITTTFTSNNVVGQRSVTMSYASNNQDLITVRGPSSELLSSNAFNSTHQVTTHFNAVNDKTTFTYDSAARLTSIKSPTGLTTTNSYYSSGSHIGWLQQSSNLEIGATNGFGYSNGVVSNQTNALGLTVSYVRDSLDRVLELHTPSVNLTNTYNRLNLVSTANGDSTNRFAYDCMGQMTNSVNPRGGTNQAQFCGCGFAVGLTNALLNYSSFLHDSDGHQVQAKLPDQSTTVNWNYDILGQTTNLTIVGVASITNYYNNQGLPSVSSNALGQIFSYLYDVYDRPTNVTDVNGITITNSYDLLGRVLTKAYPDGGVEKYSYGPAGVTAYTNQLGKITYYGYDAAGRLTSTTNANTEITRLAYDAAGNTTQVTDGKGQNTWFTFDSYSRLIRQTNATGTLILTNGYDSKGHLTARWTAAKGLTAYAYDQSGNLTNVDYSASTDLRYSYDIVNHLTNMVDAVGTTTFAYDANGALTSEDGPWGNDTVGYSYQNGQRTGMTIQQPYSSTQYYYYAYDTINRLSTITSPSGTYTYNYSTTDPTNGKGSLVKKIALPNGSYITNSFNNMGQLLSTLLNTSGNATLNLHAYTYNTGGQRTRQTRTAGDYVDYGYDSIGQLTSALGKESGGSTSRLQEQFGYGYDAAGNLQNRTNNALIQTFTVDSLNQLSNITRSGSLTVAGLTTTNASSVTINGSYTANRYADNSFAASGVPISGGANTYTASASDSAGRSASTSVTVNVPSTPSFTYDLNGNLVSDGTTGYDYDDANQLVRVRGTNWTSEYVYDGKMRRRIKREWQNPQPTTAAVTSTTPSATTFNSTTWNGTKFTVGSTPIVVTDLGRWKLSGNSGTHTLKLVDADHNDIVGASVSVSLASGSSGQYIYATLSTPVVLGANTTYFLMSLETGEAYCAENSTLTTTSALTINNGAYFDGAGWHEVGGSSYGPLSFKYETLLTASETHYVYDGKLVVQERNGDNLPTTTYTRGLDLSGSLSGAGGIGGLLGRTDHTTPQPQYTVQYYSTAFYHQDGNGNVTALVDLNQRLTAKYAYDPFGRVLAKSGALCDANRMQFSGKECDSATGLSYYGLRYYDPALQRWLNRDPSGGVNLFKALGNAPFSYSDPNGLKLISTYSDNEKRYGADINSIPVVQAAILAEAMLVSPDDPTLALPPEYKDINWDETTMYFDVSDFAYNYAVMFVNSLSPNGPSEEDLANFAKGLGASPEAIQEFRKLSKGVIILGGAAIAVGVTGGLLLSGMIDAGAAGGAEGSAGEGTLSRVFTRRSLASGEIRAGMEVNPAEFNMYRGGSSLNATLNDVKIIDGMVQPTRGVSLFSEPSGLGRFGGAYRIESIPNELKIIQRGNNLQHFEIVPRSPMSMDQFQQLLRRIVISEK